MPLCAILSALMFRRLYGWLEIHGLAFLTLTIMIFMERIARRRLSHHGIYEIHSKTTEFSHFGSVFHSFPWRAGSRTWRCRREFLVQVLAGSVLDPFLALESLEAVHFNLVSIVGRQRLKDLISEAFSCLSSVYLEKLLKPKYSERSSLDRHFYIQKASKSSKAFKSLQYSNVITYNILY